MGPAALNLLVLAALHLPDVSGVRYQIVTVTDKAPNCDVYTTSLTTSSKSVETVIQCARLVSTVAGTSFYVCPSSLGTAPLVCTPTEQVFAPPQQTCSVYSTQPVPTKMPQQTGTKRYFLSSLKASDGSTAALEAGGYCSSSGGEFGTIESDAEHIKFLLEVSTEIGQRCVNHCFAWVYTTSDMYWANGVPLDRCVMPVAVTTLPGNECFSKDWKEQELRRASCTAEDFPVLCQKFGDWLSFSEV